MQDNRLHIMLSSSALTTSGCILHFKRKVIDGFKPKLMPSRMVYGIAVHKFIDTFYKTGDYIQSIGAAKAAFQLPKVGEIKSKWLDDERHMICTCQWVWSEILTQSDIFSIIELGGKPATEQTFKILYYEDENIVVWLCGTIDKLGVFRGGCYAIGDWKFTSSWDKKRYFEQYELSRSLRFYTLACKLMAEKEPESTIGKIGATKMGCFIDAIFLKKDPNEVSWSRSPVYQYSQSEMDMFRCSLGIYINRLAEYATHSGFGVYQEGILNGSCEGKWGVCDFWNICKTNNQIGDILLKRDFDKAVFNPMDYNALG